MRDDDEETDITPLLLTLLASVAAYWFFRTPAGQETREYIMGNLTFLRRAGGYLPLIQQIEKQNGIPQNLLVRLLDQESKFRPEVIDGTVRSRTGAIGIAQVLPSTAGAPGYSVPRLVNPRDPSEAIPWAGKYLRAMYDRAGSWPKALAAYNQGLGTVLNAAKSAGANWLKAVPAEGRNYVASITSDVPVLV